jgi:proline iminopeptidase
MKRAFAILLAAALACSSGAEPAWRSGYVTTADGARLYYVDIGAGDQVVVIPMALYLSEVLAPLAEGRRLVFYDPRGRGRSDPADTSVVSLNRQVADLEELRAGLGIERMALLGWSGPGMEVAVYAMRYPERVTRIVQVSPVPPADAIMRSAGGDTRDQRTDTAAVNALLRRFSAGEYAADPAGFCREYNRLTLPGNFADPALATRVPDVCGSSNEWPVNLWPYFGALIGSFGGYDWRDSMALLTMPRLILHGREDGIPLAGARAWAAGQPNARLIEVSRAGHFIFIEQPQEFFPPVRAFLNGEWPAEARQLPRIGA